MPKIVTHLWFDDQAEEAARFYVSLFKNSRIKATSRYPKGTTEVTGKQEGSVMTVAFELDGQDYIALNGGPHFKFNEAVSLLVECESQEEIDRLWSKLTEGGKEQPCGWLKDKYGLSWQISHVELEQLVHDPDSAKVGRVMQAMFPMKKIDVRRLQQAAAGG